MSNIILDRRTIDSTGAFLLGQLEKFDPKVNMPLQITTWSRDIPVRNDVSIGHEFASYTLDTFADAGNGIDQGPSFTGKGVTAPSSIEVDNNKIVQPLYQWTKRVGYSLTELASSQLQQLPIDMRKVTALQRVHQLQMDQVAYTGATAQNAGYTGLFNNAAVVAQGITSSVAAWSGATPAQIQADINNLIANVVATAATAVAPTVVLVSHADMAILTQPITSAGSISIKEFIEENNLAKSMGFDLEIRACKWCAGSGVGGKTRVVAYNQDMEYLQFPFVPLQRTPLVQIGSQFLFDYVGKFGQLEVRFPETVGYMDHG